MFRVTEQHNPRMQHKELIVWKKERQVDNVTRAGGQGEAPGKAGMGHIHSVVTTQRAQSWYFPVAITAFTIAGRGSAVLDALKLPSRVGE